MGASFSETIAGQTMNLDVSKIAGGARDMPSLCTDLLLIAIRMREAEDLGDPSALRKLIRYYLDLFRKNCAACGIAEPAARDGLYAIVALIDETVLSSPGEARNFWFTNPIQLELFGESVAGEEFFRKLQNLLAQPEKNKDTLEVYYLCLSLGFEGKYKIANPEERHALIAETGKRLRRSKIRVSSGISPHGARSDFVPSARRMSALPLWVGAIIAGVAAIASYIIARLSVSADLGAALQAVERLHMH